MARPSRFRICVRIPLQRVPHPRALFARVGFENVRNSVFHFILSTDALITAELDSRNRIGQWKKRKNNKQPGLITFIVSHPREHRARMGHPTS